MADLVETLWRMQASRAEILGKAAQEIERLRAALEFYAAIVGDRGNKARQALETPAPPGDE